MLAAARPQQHDSQQPHLHLLHLELLLGLLLTQLTAHCCRCC
jgi:hypothetical protein